MVITLKYEAIFDLMYNIIYVDIDNTLFASIM